MALVNLDDVMQPVRGTRIIPMDPAGLLDYVQLDVTTSINFRFGVSVSRSSVEQDLSYGDHSVINPDEISVSGVLTNTPIAFMAGVRPIANEARQNLQKLRGMITRRQPVFVLTSRIVALDMLPTSLDVPVSPEDGDSITINMSFEKLKIVRLAYVTSVIDIDAIIFGGGGTVNLGQQSTINPSDYTGPIAPVG